MLWAIFISFLMGIFVCVVVEGIVDRNRDRDIARDELGNKMNLNQAIKWIVDELRQARSSRVYLAEIHCGVQQIRHILKHVHPDALTPEQTAAITKATADLDAASTDLSQAVQSQEKEQ